MPSRHWRATSIQELRWNWISWPDGLPRKKNGEITAVAVSTTNTKAMRVGIGAPGVEESAERNCLIECFARMSLMTRPPRKYQNTETTAAKASDQPDRAHSRTRRATVCATPDKLPDLRTIR
jgi:hypothetical protein